MTKLKKPNVTRLNIHEAKTHLSRYVADVEAGEQIILCRNGVPVAQITPIDTQGEFRKKRFGLAKGLGEVTSEFFEPLTDDDMPDVGL